jgi:hypothetical protein
LDQIHVIVVSWNDAGDVSDAVASLAASRSAVGPGGPAVSLTLVVNGPTEVRREAILSQWPDATIVFNERNRGFGPAVNQAALHATADVLLFVNPDTRAEGDVFSPLARGFRDHPEAAALAPRLLDESGPDAPAGRAVLAPPGRENQFTFQLRGLPTPASDAREMLLFDHLFPNNSGRRRYRYADADRSRPFEVGQAAAAAFAVRTEAFRKLQGFDERFAPAWFEDVDLCARLHTVGKILYWPESRFRHRGGASSQRLGYARFLPIYYRNALLYRRLHFGMAARAFYRALLPAGMLLRLAAVPFRRSDPRPKGESARAYLRVLRLALGFPATESSSAPSPEPAIPDPGSSRP